MKYIIISLVLFSFFISCDTITNSERIINASSSEFIPLKVGNSWTYKCISSFDSSLTIETIIGDTIINNKKYWILESNNNEKQYGRTYFIRMDGNKFYLTYDGEKGFMFDVSISSSEEYEYNGYKMKASNSVDVITNLGKFKDCIDYKHDDPLTIDEEGGHIFKKGIGIVKSYGVWGISHELVDYRIE